jgi:hypothetical protein
MKLYKDQELLLDDIISLNSIFISWTGGGYGNFLYRTIHRFIEGFPNFQDNYKFSVNGGSHGLYQYINDFQDTKIDKKFKVEYDIDFDFIAIKKHSTQLFPPNFLFKNRSPFFHIKVIYRDPASYVWATIQNIIKNKLSRDYYSAQLTDFNWFENNIHQTEIIFKEFQKNISTVNKYWFIPEDSLYNIWLDDILNSELLYNHLVNISKIINSNLKNEHLFLDWHQKFLANQKFLSSLHNHYDNNYNNNVLIDLVLKHATN